MIGLITALFAFGGAYLIFFDKFKDDQPIWAWLLFGGVMGWLYASLFGSTLRLWRLRSFDGPILKITDQGIVDYWSHPNCVLNWSDIEYTKWKTPHIFPVLVFVPKSKSLSYRLRSLIGLTLFEYPSTYLTLHEADIAQFVLDHAPENVLR